MDLIYFEEHPEELTEEREEQLAKITKLFLRFTKSRQGDGKSLPRDSGSRRGGEGNVVKVRGPEPPALL